VQCLFNKCRSRRPSTRSGRHEASKGSASTGEHGTAARPSIGFEERAGALHARAAYEGTSFNLGNLIIADLHGLRDMPVARMAAPLLQTTPHVSSRPARDRHAGDRHSCAD
jgi:hypothetical protein